MPPEGHTSVTLPNDLVERIDQLGAASRATAIRRALNDLEALRERDADGDDLREQLDRIESAATTAEARTGRIEGTLEDMGAGR